MYHKITIVGNLGRDPEMRYTPTGQAVANLSIASNETWNDKDTGEKVQRTTWWRASAWGKLAEVVNQYLTKGRLVYIEGTMSPDETGNPRIWNRQDGTPGASYEINIRTIKFLGGGSNGEQTSERSEDALPVEPAIGEGQEIPF